ISAAEIAVLIDVIRDSRKSGIPVRLGLVIAQKAFEPQLLVTPVPKDVIVPIQYFAVPLLEGFGIPSILVILNQFVCSATDLDHSVSPSCLALKFLPERLPDGSLPT